MPLVAPNPTLQESLATYIAQSRSTKAEAAATLGIDPMTLARFIKTGKAIDATIRKLEEGLIRVGAWVPKDAQRDAPAVGESQSIVSSDKVIAALEFLLAAARDAQASK